ncbi:helix-turn-helix transcriptional regulator [Candidatus Woesearchaeota archaeon]|jgi:transcriptional regulator with XRE-family HTH domain|nr:helix-turn-helix transcriptional regulator [Candidatus Woesearchaeota archaeon]
MARPYKNSSEHLELLKFGRAIRSIRLDKEISQEKLAELADIDRSYMGGVERGEHNLALVNIKRISDALEVSISNVMKKAGL